VAQRVEAHPLGEGLAGGTGAQGTEELVDVVRWTRTRNEAHPDDPVRIVGIDDVALESPDEAERHMAAALVAWQERTGTRTLYWGGAAHVSVGDLRTVQSPPGPPMVQRSAGSRLRDHFGPAYVSVGLTFGRGDVPWPVPPPAPELAEAVLGAAGAAALLDFHAPAPVEVRAWLDAPARLRIVGPRLGPAHDGVRHMSGGSLAGWFDMVAHVEEVSPTRPLA
jgi:erythromycin esterase